MTGTPHLREPESTHRRQEWDTVAENELRIEKGVAAQLVEGLNEELSGLYILFNQVRKHYWTVAGVEFRAITDFLEDAADRLAEMTDDFAIRVHALGGVPVCGPMGIRQHAPLYIEPPNVYDTRSSLERDLTGYATLGARMRNHVELAAEAGDEATSELLREHLETLEEDAHTLEQYLEIDTLVRR